MAQPDPPATVKPYHARFASSAARPIDLEYVPADAAFVVAVRPGDLMSSDAGKLLCNIRWPAKSPKIEKRIGLPIAEIDHATVALMDFPATDRRELSRAYKAHTISTTLLPTILRNPNP